MDISEEDYVRFMGVLKEMREEFQEGITKGRSYSDFIREGVSAEGMKWLKKEHYITWHDKKSPVWIAWQENQFYQDSTIVGLVNYARMLGYEA